jgi:hypothetical protein
MRRPFSLLFTLLPSTVAFVVPLAASAPAVAASATEIARAHFSEGIRRYDARDFAGALEAFRAAYAAKPSPGIKRNIALCLKELGLYPEALDALDELLAEGGDALKPDVRDGARAAIAEMSALVATVRLRVVIPSVAPAEHVAVVVDDKPVDPASLVKPLRLAPGEHVLRARADGYRQAERRVRLSAGQAGVPITLDLVAEHASPRGRAVIRANVAGASIAIDGVVVATGSWRGELPAGTHRVEVTAPGYPAQLAELQIDADEARELAIAIDMTNAPPPSLPAYAAPARARARAHTESRPWYAIGGLGIYGQTLRYTDALGNHEQHDTTGGSFVLHFGRALHPHVAVGVVGEIGGFELSPYDTEAFPGQRGDGRGYIYSIAPELRVQSQGKVRFVGGVAIGIAGVKVKADVPTDAVGTRVSLSGAGVSGMGLVAGGVQLDAGRVLLEGAVFAGAHGVGAARDSSGRRFFADSPVARLGVRLMVGWPF